MKKNKSKKYSAKKSQRVSTNSSSTKRAKKKTKYKEQEELTKKKNPEGKKSTPFKRGWFATICSKLKSLAKGAGFFYSIFANLEKVWELIHRHLPPS